jgi:hypothetical protein
MILIQMKQEEADHRHYQEQGDDPCAGGDATQISMMYVTVVDSASTLSDMDWIGITTPTTKSDFSPEFDLQISSKISDISVRYLLVP